MRKGKQMQMVQNIIKRWRPICKYNIKDSLCDNMHNIWQMNLAYTYISYTYIHIHIHIHICIHTFMFNLPRRFHCQHNSRDFLRNAFNVIFPLPFIQCNSGCSHFFIQAYNLLQSCTWLFYMSYFTLESALLVAIDLINNLRLWLE